MYLTPYTNMGTYQFLFLHGVAYSWCLNNIHTQHGVMQSKGDSMNRKVNEVLVASKGPFLTDMGHSISFFFFLPLPPSTGAFFKFSPYNRALYTIKPSLAPPPRQLPASDLETQVICHQRRELEETASPAWELHTGPDNLRWRLQKC